MINKSYKYLRKCGSMARKPYFLQEKVVFTSDTKIIITKIETNALFEGSFLYLSSVMASLITVHQHSGSPSIGYGQRKHNCLSVQIRFDGETLIHARNNVNCMGKVRAWGWRVPNNSSNYHKLHNFKSIYLQHISFWFK